MKASRQFAKAFWQLIGGAICMAGGVTVIFLGWYGASHTRDVTDQFPYLISGGLFGLALVVIGSALYFSYFVAQSAASSRRAQRLLEQLLGASTMERSSNDSVLTVPGGTAYHRPGCPLAAGKAATQRTAAEADADGLSPCPVCEPASVN